VRCAGGEYTIEQGLEIGDFAQAKIDITVNELVGERDAVKELGLLG
jgi:malate dehydrogenase